jgi:putative NADH-flavin reductase
MKTRLFIHEPDMGTSVAELNPPGALGFRVFVLGATGRTGGELLAQAAARGHRITAFVRSPQKLGPIPERVTTRRGDARSVAELRDALSGHDAVVSALGTGGLGATTILRDSARSVVAAMKAEGLRRLLVVSMGALFPDGGILPAVLRNTILRNVAEDSREMERIVMDSGLDWTIARPPRLTNGPLTKHYLVEDGHMAPGSLSLSRADLAHFLLSEVESNEHVQQIVGLARDARRLSRESHHSPT